MSGEKHGQTEHGLPAAGTGESSRRLWQTTLVRTIVVTVLIGSTYLYLHSLPVPIVLWPLVLLLAATCLLNGFVWLGLRKGISVIRLTYPQLIWDIFLISELVYYTGGIDSPLVPLYFIAIYEASIFLGLKGSVIIAGQSSLVYGFLVWSVYKGIIAETIPSAWLSTATYQLPAILINIYLYICFFLLSAFVSGYLAERLRRKGEELETASHLLRRIKLDTDNIMRNMAGGLITVDHEGKVVYFNPAAQRIVGITDRSVNGRPCREVFVGGLSPLGERIMEAFETGVVHSRCEVFLKDQQGRDKPIGLTTALVHDEQGHAGGVVVNFQDLTEVKRIEELMRRTDRLAAVGELSAGIAHEIRNPLASISGSVEVLKESLSPTGENERLLDLIIRESDRLNKIISEFLHFARLKTPDIQRLVLNDIVEDVFSLLQNHPQNHERIVMKNILGPEAIAVRFDEDHLRQLLINLMVNGLEAMPDGGELAVGLCANGMKPAMADAQYVKIFVSDSGTGIDESVRDRIFEPFISTKKNGTGLGLSIVQRILEYNHGKIDLGENRPKRVSFTVSLPRV